MNKTILKRINDMPGFISGHALTGINKNYFLPIGKSFLYVLLLTIVLSSCKEKTQETDILQRYIESVETVSPKAENIQVDNFAHLIVLDYNKPTDLSNVQLKLTLGNGVELIQPTETLAYFDLIANPLIKLKYKGQSFTYHFKINYLTTGYDPSSKGWTLSIDFGDMPEYVSVYKSPKTYEGKNLIGFIAVADMNNSRGSFSVLGESYGYHTPVEFYESSAKPVVVMNAGYFWDGYALGLVARDGKIIQEGNPMVWRTLGGVSTVYYPTQAAFGYNKNRVFAANWVYTNSGITYSYPSPAPNKTGIEPLPVPSSSYPAGAFKWDPVMAISAGPLIIKGGVYYNTWEAEMFDEASGVGPNINNPRSAIGITLDGYLIFFICEGRNMTPDTPGLTLKNVADIMLDLGCCEAINLDGGGSSYMLVNGEETIKPSDGQQRKIVTAVAIY